MMIAACARMRPSDSTRKVWMLGRQARRPLSVQWISLRGMTNDRARVAFLFSIFFTETCQVHLHIRTYRYHLHTEVDPDVPTHIYTYIYIHVSTLQLPGPHIDIGGENRCVDRARKEDFQTVLGSSLRVYRQRFCGMIASSRGEHSQSSDTTQLSLSTRTRV